MSTKKNWSYCEYAKKSSCENANKNLGTGWGWNKELKGGGPVGVGWWQGECERRIEVIVKMQRKKRSRGGREGGPVRVDGCEQRIKVIV